MSLNLSNILDNPYALKLNSLTNLVDLASTAGDMFLVSKENGEDATYLFDTRADEEVSLESDITDNWVEANYTIQDHIGLKPLQITLSGYVGELSNKPKNELERQTKSLSKQLEGLSPFAPSITTQANALFSSANQIYGVYEKANDTVGKIEDMMNGIPVPQEVSKQQQAFGKFYELWVNRQLFTIYTPFGAYNSMAIQRLQAKQSDSSTSYSDFSITFKQIRIADRIAVYKDTKKSKGRTAQTLSKEVDKGTKKPTSTLFKAEQKAFSFMQ